MSSTDQADTEQRKVHLPLRKLDQCAECGKSTSLRLCSSCGEGIYCSSECQKADWPEHKKTCGKTDRIDLAYFYPFLACLAEAAHIHPDKPVHPALTHAIINAPNPGTSPTMFVDRSAAKLILLGDPISMTEMGSPKWWPKAASDKVRSKLLRRIGREGFLLPILTSLCVALLAEVYTTTAVRADASPDGKEKRRTRLQYHSSPISDFGIVKGVADVKHQDKLAYFNLTDNTFQKGQDPDDHYWLYFTTIRGEEFTLDCGMFTFNFCMMVRADSYCQHALPPISFAPSFFRDRIISRSAPLIAHERERFSVLQNTDLHRAIESSGSHFRGSDTRLIWEFMEHVAGRECTGVEKDLLMKWTINNCTALGITLANRAWKSWPKEPPLAIETDPGEMSDTPAEEDEEWWKYMKRWNRKHKRGEITAEELGVAFRAWDERHKKTHKRKSRTLH